MLIEANALFYRGISFFYYKLSKFVTLLGCRLFSL